MQRNTDTVDNRVIVRVWPANVTSSSPNSWIETGHVSLKIYIHGEDDARDYISFWPGDDKTNSTFWSWFADKKTGCPCKEKGCDQKVDHFHTREQDVQYCGQAQIENTYTFYTLDAIAISREFERRKPGLKWTLSASLLPIKDETIANCSSLVYDLLACGGLDNLINRNDRQTIGLRTSAKLGFTSGALISVPITRYFLMPYYMNLSRKAGDLIIKNLYLLPHKQLYNREIVESTINVTLRNNFSFFNGRIALPFLKAIEDRLGYSYFSAMIGNLTIISNLALTTAVATGSAYFAYKALSYFFTIKPSDMTRIIPRAEEIDHKNRFFSRTNLPTETPQENHPLQRRFG